MVRAALLSLSIVYDVDFLFTQSLLLVYDVVDVLSKEVGHFVRCSVYVLRLILLSVSRNE